MSDYDPRLVGIATTTYTSELEIYDSEDRLIIRTTGNVGPGNPFPDTILIINKEA